MPNYIFPCITCAKIFDSPEQLKNHQMDTYHFRVAEDVTTIEEAQYLYLNAFFREEVMIAKADRRKARKIVQALIQDVMKKVTTQDQIGRMMYSEKLIPAGSTSTQTKVGKADEFDYNVPLNVQIYQIRSSGEVYYDFRSNLTYQSNDQELTALSDHKEIVHSPFPTEIPEGYCVAKIFNRSKKFIWEYSHNRDLIPRYVQEDLHEKLERAIENRGMQDDMDVKLQKFPHGPAVTIIVKNKHDHNISIDFAASIELNGDSALPDWPRKDTKLCLPEETIDQICSAGVHLVPKNDLFWYISYSKAAKVLMNMIDGWDECRRRCHMIMKRDFQIWQSKSAHGFKGISTYIFKHHLFWMNETHRDEESYWQEENIGTCYIDMLTDLASCLREQDLRNYFNSEENILENKNGRVLRGLAECMMKRVAQLKRIKINP